MLTIKIRAQNYKDVWGEWSESLLVFGGPDLEDCDARTASSSELFVFVCLLVCIVWHSLLVTKYKNTTAIILSYKYLCCKFLQPQ